MPPSKCSVNESGKNNKSLSNIHSPVTVSVRKSPLNLGGGITILVFIIHHHHHHHHVVQPARISLTLSLHVSLSFIASGRSSGLHPVSSHICCMYVRAGRPAFDWPYAGVHRSTSLTSSSLLLQSNSFHFSVISRLFKQSIM